MKKIRVIFLFLMASLCASSVQAADYESSIGARLAERFGVTWKSFLNDNSAIEVIGYTNILRNQEPLFVGATGLYEIHNDIASVEGLQWYYGGGAHVGLFLDDIIADKLFAGLDGILGLEYKIPDVPVAISVDWIPTYDLVGDSGFYARNGGLSVRYTF